MSDTDVPARLDELQSRIRRYHQVELEAVMEVISYLREDGDRVIFGGSLTLGLGNARSDLDVLLIGPPGVDGSRLPLEHWIDGLRVDVWKLTERLVDGVFLQVERALASEGPIDGAFGDVGEQADLKLLHRIVSGIQVEGEPLELSTRLGAAELARDLVSREYGERMRDSAYLAQVGAATGHDLAAAVYARGAVEEAAHAALAGMGVPFTGDKWLRERLRDFPEMEASYAPFAVLPEGPGTSAEFVAAALATCREWTGADLAAPLLAARATWRLGDLRLMPIGDESLLLSVELGALWSLEPAEAAAWQRFGEAGAWPCEECDAEQDSLAFALHVAGVAKLDWSQGLDLERSRLEEAVSA